MATFMDPANGPLTLGRWYILSSEGQLYDPSNCGEEEGEEEGEGFDSPAAAVDWAYKNWNTCLSDTKGFNILVSTRIPEDGTFYPELLACDYSVVLADDWQSHLKSCYPEEYEAAQEPGYVPSGWGN